MPLEADISQEHFQSYYLKKCKLSVIEYEKICITIVEHTTSR